MARPFWLRPIRVSEKPAVSVENVAKAVARRETLDTLLKTSATLLSESTHADRAGVWAEETPGDPLWPGHLIETESMGGLSEPCKVNAFEVFPVEFNEANLPLEFFAPVFPVGPRDFFEGISIGVGVPLKIDDYLLGALLVGSGPRGALGGRGALENVSAEIAVSLFANRVREQQRQNEQSLLPWKKFSVASPRSRHTRPLLNLWESRDAPSQDCSGKGFPPRIFHCTRCSTLLSP
jgi:hypothetical protein